MSYYTSERVSIYLFIVKIEMAIAMYNFYVIWYRSPEGSSTDILLSSEAIK